jgi:hypothetical protein
MRLILEIGCSNGVANEAGRKLTLQKTTTGRGCLAVDTDETWDEQI